MALQRTVVWSCPNGNFQAEGDMQVGRVAMRAKNTKHIRPGWTNTTINEFETAIAQIQSKYISSPTTTSWDNTAKTLTITLNFPDAATADAASEETNTYVNSFILDSADTDWTFVSSADSAGTDA